VVDGFVYWRTGTSLATRSWRKYIGLFLISAPVWWLFELLNWRVQNWFYDGRELLSDLVYGLLATVAFSTVIPAVFGTAELISSFAWTQRFRRGPVIRPDKPLTLTFFVTGWLMLGMMLVWPRYFFPFIWMSLYFLIAPINVWLGNQTLLRWLQLGDWRPVVTLFVGVLITAFFWEFWNYFSYPKWIYTIPFVDFWYVFEMPLLGYGGYLPFALELFATYHLVMGLFGDSTQYLRFDFE
jgi:hypothetical protein